MSVTVRLAPALDSYRPIPYRGEDLRAVIRREACACGRDIEQIAGDDIPATMRRHNLTHEHLLWRAER